MSNVLTGALAIIRVNGTALGKMRNIRVTENQRRVNVSGLGTILTLETPVVEWTGSLTCSFYEIDFQSQGVKNAIRRDVQTSQDFEREILLNEDGIQLDIFKRVKDFVGDNGDTVEKAVPYAIIKRCFPDSESFNIDSGSVAGRDQSFRYLDPIIFPS